MPPWTAELARMRIERLGDGSLWIMAARMRRSKSAVSRMESGQSVVGPETIALYAEALVEGTGKRPPYRRCGHAYWMGRLAWLRGQADEAARKVYRRR